MGLILNIDTSLDTALVNIADNGNVVIEQINPQQRDHSTFLENAIDKILKQAGFQLGDLSAFAVVSGPGSYTGLRIGMASVKALCYALQKPLILLNKLEVLAAAAIKQNDTDGKNTLYCPMIDARRMEVFTAIYDRQMKQLLSPVAMVLNEASFKETLEINRMYFFGNGAEKWRGLCKHKNADFITASNEGWALATLSSEMLNNQGFSDVAYASPLYLKEFFFEGRQSI